MIKPDISPHNAREMYEEYYKSLYDTEPSDHRVEGFHWRKRIHILKLACLCSLSDKDDLILTPPDIEAAREIISLVEPKMARTFTAVGKFAHAADLERMQAQIIAAGDDGILESELRRQNYYVGSGEVLDSMINSLVLMGAATRVKGEDDKWRLTKTMNRAIWEK